MKRKDNIFKKRHMSVLLVLLLIAGIGVGYAALTATLTINGTTTINAVTWDVHFENAAATDNANVNGTVTIDPNDKTKATYTATLAEPGDVYEFTIDVVNRGSIDAKLLSKQVQELTPAEDVVVNYEIDTIPADGAKLDKCTDTNCATTTDKTKFGNYTLRIKIEYDHDIEAKDLPSEPLTISKEIKLNYVQNQ